jgi:chromosome segregation ATPase
MVTRSQLIKAIVLLIPWAGQIPDACSAATAGGLPPMTSDSRNAQPADHETSRDKELKRLQSILVTLNQELEATYHQFQMIQEARRGIVQSMFDPRPGLDPRSYDEMVRDRERALAQEKELSDQMNRLLDKARTIEAKMNPILERVYQLIPDSESDRKAETYPPPKPEKESGTVQIKPIPY